MLIRENYLKKMVDAKDIEFIKVITGVRRSGKSTLLLMFKDYLLNNNVNEDNIIYINFESAKYDDIKNYKDLYNYVKDKIKEERIYLLLDEVQNVESWEKAINSFKVDFVAENPNTIKYFQVTRSLLNEDVKMRELRSLESINDNYEKIILTMDKTINNDYNGIKVINIIDWLLKDE